MTLMIADVIIITHEEIESKERTLKKVKAIRER